MTIIEQWFVKIMAKVYLIYDKFNIVIACSECSIGFDFDDSEKYNLKILGYIVWFER